MQPRTKSATGGPVPQHSQFEFADDGVRICSDFDSGNVHKAERVDAYVYELWTGPDCVGTLAEAPCRTWFYFSLEAPAGTRVQLTLKNLNLQGKLFREGMRPVFKTASQPWTRVSGPLACNVTGVGVLWGFRDERELADNGAHFLAPSPRALVELFDSVEVAS